MVASILLSWGQHIFCGMQHESTPSLNAAAIEKVKLTSLCHKEPQVFGTLVPILEKHHLLLVSVTVVLLCVHVFSMLLSRK